MSKRLTTSEYKEKLREAHGDRFELLSEYVDSTVNVTLRCNICGGIISKRPATLTTKRKDGCYICSGKNSHKTTQSFQNELDLKYPGVYTVVGEYKKARQPLLVHRNPCGHTYMVSPDNALRGKGCPKCSLKQSHYMDHVEQILDRFGVKYVKEKRFDDCKNERCLPFDYYIEALNTCIEVDGEFHYRTNTFSDNAHSSQYEAVKMRDAIKTEYCLSKGITLIRLPYFEEDRFEEILTSQLHVNTEITTPISKAG